MPTRKLVKGQMVRENRQFFNKPAPQTINISSTHAESNAFGCDEILIQTDTECFFIIDSAPVATVATGHFMPAYGARSVTVDPSDKISIITASATGNFYISAVG